MSKKDKKRLLLQVYEKKCTGCGRCTARCSRGVLKLVDKTDGHYARIEHPSRCKACGKCVRTCRSGALRLSPASRPHIPEYYDAVYMLFSRLSPGYK